MVKNLNWNRLCIISILVGWTAFLSAYFVYCPMSVPTPVRQVKIDPALGCHIASSLLFTGYLALVALFGLVTFHKLTKHVRLLFVLAVVLPLTYFSYVWYRVHGL